MATVLVVQANPGAEPVAESDDYVTYIIGFNNDASMATIMDDQMNAFVSDNSGEILYRYDSINAIAVKVPKEAAGNISSLKNIRYAEKEVTFHAYLDTGAGIVGAPEVWESNLTGKGVKVAVVDSGIDGSHPDFKGRIIGWKDIVANKNQPYDDFGHGTHCAGIIAGDGAGSNGKYMGIAPEAELIGVKVLGQGGSGSEAAIIAGIEYAMNSGAKVISLSLGSDQHSQGMDDVVNKAIDKGIIVICAAGNSGPSRNTVGCPSHVERAITVGATDKNDQIASFSSRGPTSDGRTKPDIAAPGKDIISARATGIKNEKAIDNYYLSMSGTSMACPMTSGTVALMLQKDPSLTPAKAKEILTASAKRLGSGVPNNDYGFGRISVKNAIAYMDGKFKPEPVPSPTPTPSVKPSPTVTPGYPYPGYPSPTVKPSPTANPGNPYPGYPGYPYPGYNPYPGYPYPGYNPYPGYPGYNPYPGYPYPGYSK